MGVLPLGTAEGSGCLRVPGSVLCCPAIASLSSGARLCATVVDNASTKHEAICAAQESGPLHFSTRSRAICSSQPMQQAQHNLLVLHEQWSEADIRTWCDAEYQALPCRIPDRNNQQRSQPQSEAAVTCNNDAAVPGDPLSMPVARFLREMV